MDQLHAAADLSLKKEPPGTHWIVDDSKFSIEVNNLAMPGIEPGTSSQSLYRLDCIMGCTCFNVRTYVKRRFYQHYNIETF
jgi:hypothetical protein